MYELMVVASPNENADNFVKKLEGFLTDAKVTSLKTERLGKKPLAYQIRKQAEGEYVLFTFESSSDLPASIVSKLKIEQEAVLRYLLTKTKAAKVGKEIKKTDAKSVEKAVEIEDNTQDNRKKKTAAKKKITVRAKGNL